VVDGVYASARGEVVVSFVDRSTSFPVSTSANDGEDDCDGDGGDIDGGSDVEEVSTRNGGGCDGGGGGASFGSSMGDSCRGSGCRSRGRPESNGEMPWSGFVAVVGVASSSESAASISKRCFAFFA
jgi:hypothetical protein